MKRTLFFAAICAVFVSCFSQDEQQWALTNTAVANMRENPSHSAELGTQTLMGMPVKILEQSGDWYKVESPDGYKAWVEEGSIDIKSDAEMERWRHASRLVVTNVYQTRAYTSPTASGLRDVVTDLVLGDIVEGTLDSPVAGRVEILLPDGRRAWADVADLTPIEQWADQPFDAQKILDTAYSLMGTYYLWGGTSVKGLDCSGLSKTAYMANGIMLYRNASQQARTGTCIEADQWRTLQPGDLLFFGNLKTGKVTHVAIYEGDGMYVHASGAGRVKRNSVDPESPDCPRPMLHAVRIHGSEGTPGITPFISHPWYF